MSLCREKRVLTAVLLLSLFTFFACGKPKQTPPETLTQTDTGGTSTSGSSSTQGSLSVSIFPHTDDWAKPAIHGDWVTKNGKIVCLRCHTTTQASVEGAPACGSCHILYPHSSDWINKEVHGNSVLKNGKSTCATECHGTDLAGGLSKVSCNLCHSIYPHPAAFSSPSEHGGIAKGDGKVLCIGCHGEDYRGGGSGVSCFQCHSKYPHASNWMNPLNHGADVVANGTVGCATQCHGSDFKGGISGVSCTTCHATFPHADGWENFSGHSQYVLTTLNGNTTTCQRCHGTDLRGGGTGISCYSCHTSYPHPANWREASQHGPAAYGSGKTGCATANCHGTAFEGSPQAPSCRNCHAVFPHITPAWTTLTPGRESQRDNSFHGDQFVRLIQTGETFACTECHGASYDRVLGGSSCKQCHAFGITHKETNGAPWQEGGGHGKFFSDRFKATDANLGCWKCHGNPVNFDAVQTKNNLNTASFCYNCHFAYPHIGWNDAAGWNALWEPVVNDCLPKQYLGFGHTYYLPASPLFTDDQGTRPIWGTTPNLDPLWGNALRNTCGSAGSCHTNGARSYQSGGGGGPCGTSCHAGGARVEPMPTLPNCRPDPSLEIPGPPTVVSTVPANGAQNIAGNAIITIQFSEAMKESSFDAEAAQADTITLKKGGGAVGRRISCDNNDWCKTVTVTPLVPLIEDGSQYQVTVTTVVKDFGGTPMAANYVWPFNTTNVDVTPPTVLSTTPRNRQSNVSLTPIITVEFSEPMDQTSATSAGAYSLTLTSDNSGVPTAPPTCVTGTDCRKTTFRLPSGRVLNRGTNYTVRVNTVVKDKANNRLQNTYTWTFTTRY